VQNFSRNKRYLTSKQSLIFLLVWIWNFTTGYLRFKKN